MNRGQKEWTRLLRVGSLAAACMAAAGLQLSCSLDCGSRNDSALFLRSVPVKRAAAAGDDTSKDYPASTELERIISETYTIEPGGEFTLSQSVERKVAYLGANLSVVESDSAKRLGVEPFGGVLVRGVSRDGPAEHGGLLVDDVITTFAGKEVTSPERLEYLVGQAGPGSPVDLSVIRKGSKLPLRLELGSETPMVNVRVLERKLEVRDDRSRTGLRLAELPDDVRPAILGPGNTEKGLLVIEILPGGPAFSSDLRARDCVVKVGGAPVSTLAEYEKALEGTSPGDEVAFAVLRDGSVLETMIELEEDATASGGFDALGVVEYDGRASGSEFSLLWGILFNAESCSSVRKHDHGDRLSPNWSEFRWGTILDLIQFKHTPKEWQLRLLWLFPIRASSS